MADWGLFEMLTMMDILYIACYNYNMKKFFIVYMIFLVVLTSFAQNSKQDVRGVVEEIFGSSKDSKEDKSNDRVVLSEKEKRIEKQRFLGDMSLAYDYIFKNYYKDPDPKKIVSGALKGILTNLGDPYSTFITPEKAKEYSENISGEFGGLGIRIDVGVDDTQTSYIKVLSPIKNTPAERKGIRSGDLIIAVGDVSLANVSLNDAVNIMRGKPGTKVTLTIKRQNNLFQLDIVRAIINNIELTYDFIDDSIAYLNISNFSQDLYGEFQEAVQKINEKPYKALLVDLRNNPGGSLQSVLKIADAFLSEGIIVGTKARNESESKEYMADARVLIPKDKKVYVLVNAYSASASEILSGAIKFSNRGKILGSKTYGKGLVQVINGFESGFISLTVSQYYTPGDHYINGRGIFPDIEINANEENLIPEEDLNMRTILKDDLARKFVEQYKGNVRNKDSLAQFKTYLKQKGLIISNDIVLKKLLLISENRYNNIIKNYNLETDIILQKAVDIIEKEVI